MNHIKDTEEYEGWLYEHMSHASVSHTEHVHVCVLV